MAYTDTFAPSKVVQKPETFCEEPSKTITVKANEPRSESFLKLNKRLRTTKWRGNAAVIMRTLRSCDKMVEMNQNILRARFGELVLLNS